MEPFKRYVDHLMAGVVLQFTEIEAKKSRDRAALARGEKPEDADEPYEPYGKEDEGMKGGFLIPLAPFGIPKFDNGERFDLKVLCCAVHLSLIHISEPTRPY